MNKPVKYLVSIISLGVILFVGLLAFLYLMRFYWNEKDRTFLTHSDEDWSYVSPQRLYQYHKSTDSSRSGYLRKIDNYQYYDSDRGGKLAPHTPFAATITIGPLESGAYYFTYIDWEDEQCNFEFKMISKTESIECVDYSDARALRYGAVYPCCDQQLPRVEGELFDGFFATVNWGEFPLEILRRDLMGPLTKKLPRQ